MKSINIILDKLQQSTFRNSFQLTEKDIKYINDKGMATIKSHAHDFVVERLSCPHPINDGKQTPTKGHPIFVGQHATACCCRGCLEKWHGIQKGKPLTSQEVNYIVDVLVNWIYRQLRQK